MIIKRSLFDTNTMHGHTVMCKWCFCCCSCEWNTWMNTRVWVYLHCVHILCCCSLRLFFFLYFFFFWNSQTQSILTLYRTVQIINKNANELWPLAPLASVSTAYAVDVPSVREISFYVCRYLTFYNYGILILYTITYRMPNISSMFHFFICIII